MKIPRLRHFLLVSEMLGVESLVTVEFILMFANLQALGVPLVYASLPIFGSASLSILMIPILGQVNLRFAKSLKQKAACLLLVNIVQLFGVGLVILANVMKLLSEENANGSGGGGSITPPGGSNFSDTTTPSSSFSSLFPFPSTNGSNSKNNNSDEDYLTIYNNYGGVTSSPAFGQNGLINIIVNGSSTTMTSASGVPPPPPPHHHDDQTGSGSGLKVYSVVGIIGYMLMDSCYDIGSCFLKTFALASTPSQHHSGIIVKTIFASSIGGCLATFLASLGVPKMIAGDSGLDINALTVIFLYGVLTIVTVPSIATSMLTGLCCLYGTGGQLGEEEHDAEQQEEGIPRPSITCDEATDERQRLLKARPAPSYAFDDHSGLHVSVSSVRNDEPAADSASSSLALLSSNNSISRDDVRRVWQLSQSGAHSLMEQTLTLYKTRQESTSNNHDDYGGTNRTNDEAPPRSCLEKCRKFFREHEKLIVICTANYFGLGAMFSFNMYSINFVATTIYHGDATAPIESPEYANYAHGVVAGSTGLLLFYIFFLVGTSLQAFILNKIGWWMEMLGICLLYIVANVSCAVFQTVWIYYVTACLNGIYRSTLFTVPYILVCRVAPKSPSGTSDAGSSWDVAVVATMLPLCMATISPLIGPLITITGTAASPLYFTSVCAFVGMAMFSRCRKY